MLAPLLTVCFSRVPLPPFLLCLSFLRQLYTHVQIVPVDSFKCLIDETVDETVADEE